MLVLTRKARESILIGQDVEVIVVKIRGDRVRLGVRAPADVQVDRREIRLFKEQRLKDQSKDSVPPRDQFDEDLQGW